MSHTVVVGGGLAGIAAAVALSLASERVTLFERRRVLGGRASAFPVETGWLDNCQHVILGSCVNLMDLLKKLGTDQRVSFHSEIPFFELGKTTVIHPSRLPVPLHFLPSFLKAPLFNLKEKWEIVKLFSKLRTLSMEDPSLDQMTLETWLIRNNQSPESIANFWNIVFVSSLNETLNRISAKYGVMVLKETFFRKREFAEMGTPNVSLSELYHEAAESLFQKGKVKVVYSNVKAYDFTDSKPKVILDDGTMHEGDTLISAVPFYNLLPLLPEPMREDPFFSQTKNLETSPILGIHLWFDRHVTKAPFGAFPVSPIHWFFSKPPQDEGQYIQLVVSACRDFMNESTESLVDLGLQELRKIFPGKMQAARLVQSRVVRESRATFSPLPGVDRFRPTQVTPVPRFFLAGDWTQTGWPATMEGAVRSGYQAAAALLARKSGN